MCWSGLVCPWEVVWCLLAGSLPLLRPASASAELSRLVAWVKSADLLASGLRMQQHRWHLVWGETSPRPAEPGTHYLNYRLKLPSFTARLFAGMQFAPL